LGKSGAYTVSLDCLVSEVLDLLVQLQTSSLKITDNHYIYTTL